MKLRILKIASRKSKLALWQANFVKETLQSAHPHLQIEIKGMTTKGDQILDVSLNKIGGKGLFVKELENSLLASETDIAVHSVKDVTVDFPNGLMLAVFCEREDPRDAFVSNQYQSLNDLPKNAIVGTSSLRRQAQILGMRPDLQCKDLRGNVNTRLKKLDDGEFDAIILAAAGLKRLEKENRIQAYFDPNQFIPAIGQGALGIECRENDDEILKLISILDHPPTKQCVLAERTVNKVLEGDCHTPIGAHAILKNNQLTLSAIVASPDGSEILTANASGAPDEAITIGTDVAQALLQKGALKILR